MLVADFGSGQALWSIFWFFLFFIWIMILFRVFADLFMSKELSGFAKVMWCIFVILLPFLGVFVYLIARGDEMGKHALEAAQAQDAASREYIQSVTTSSATGVLRDRAASPWRHRTGPGSRRCRRTPGTGS